MIIYGRHSVLGAIVHRPRVIQKIWLSPEAHQGLELPKHITSQVLKPKQFSEYSHQGYLCEIDTGAWILGLSDLDHVISQGVHMWVILDHIEDPQNFGAICRCAALLGAQGIVFAKARQAPLSAAVIKASAGLAFALTMMRVANIATFLERFRDTFGGKVYGLDTKGPIPVGQMHKEKGILGLVLGNEAQGLSRLVRDRVDSMYHVPMQYPEHSLNVAQTCAIALYQMMQE